MVVDDDVEVHNPGQVVFRLCANAEPQRGAILTNEPGDVLDDATSEIPIKTKLGIQAVAGTLLMESATWRNLFALMTQTLDRGCRKPLQAGKPRLRCAIGCLRNDKPTNNLAAPTSGRWRFILTSIRYEVA